MADAVVKFKVDSVALTANQKTFTRRFDDLDTAIEYAEAKNTVEKLEGRRSQPYEVRKITTVCEVVHSSNMMGV